MTFVKDDAGIRFIRMIRRDLVKAHNVLGFFSAVRMVKIFSSIFGVCVEVCMSFLVHLQDTGVSSE